MAKAKHTASAPVKNSKDKSLSVATDIEKEFRSAGVLSYFSALPDSHQKEYTVWIEEAKKPETRVNRIAKAIVMLEDKQLGKNKPASKK